MRSTVVDEEFNFPILRLHLPIQFLNPIRKDFPRRHPGLAVVLILHRKRFHTWEHNSFRLVLLARP